MIMKKSLTVKRGMYNGIDTIGVVGAFDMIDNQIDKIADAIFNEGKTDIVFDFKETTYLQDS